jgi:hypothetical protein
MRSLGLVNRRIGFAIRIKRFRVEVSETLRNLHDRVGLTFPVKNRHQPGALLRLWPVDNWLPIIVIK